MNELGDGRTGTRVAYPLFIQECTIFAVDRAAVDVDVAQWVAVSAATVEQQARDGADPQRSSPLDRNISSSKMLLSATREEANEQHASRLARTRTHRGGRNCNRRRDFRKNDDEGGFACNVKSPLIRLRRASVLIVLSVFGPFDLLMSLL